MDQELQTLKKDILSLRNSFLSEHKTFDVIRLVPYVYDSGKVDYNLTLKADWLTEKVNTEGLWEALTGIIHRLYELRDQGKATNKTLQLVNGVDILTDGDLSEAEWNELHAIDLLAEYNAIKPKSTLKRMISLEMKDLLGANTFANLLDKKNNLIKFADFESNRKVSFSIQEKAHQR